MAFTLESAKKKVAEQFPNIELLTYTKAAESCLIKCSVHGVVEVKTFSNMMRSPMGCPRCGEDKARADATARMTKTSTLENLSIDREQIKTFTFEMAQQNVKEKFPNLELVDFQGANFPCIIRCPKHGEQTISRYSGLMQTKWGCPECGREQGRKKNKERFLHAHALAANLEPTDTTLHPWSSPSDLPTDEYVFVPFYKDVGLAAGCGTYADTTMKYQLPFGLATLRRQGIDYTKVVCCTVHGDSMEPMLMDGSTVGINTADRDIRDGKVYAIVQEGLSRIKVLSLEPGNRVRIRSVNTVYTDEVVSAADIEIIGKMFWLSTLF